MDNQLTKQNKPFAQEHLKLLACLTMLLDHAGVILVYPLLTQTVQTGIGAGIYLELHELLRSIGRLAFPVFCFLLCEGAHHTHDSRRYALRLLFAAALSEIPFDIALWGSFTWQHQNAMLTLLLGFGALKLMEHCHSLPLKLLIALPFALLAELLNTDYGGKGVWLMVLFFLTRDVKYGQLLQFLGMWCIFSPNHLMALNWLNAFHITTQEWAVLALIPISLYSGEKLSRSKGLQWAFYLFYPVHLTLLWILKGALYG